MDDVISFGESFVVREDVASSCFKVEISMTPWDEADERLRLDNRLKSAVDIVLLSRTECKLLRVVDGLAKLEEDDNESRVLLVVTVICDDIIISDSDIDCEDGPCWGFVLETANLDTNMDETVLHQL